MMANAEISKETGYIRNDNSNHVSSTQTPAASQQLENLKEKGEGEYIKQAMREKGKAAATTTITTSDAVITQHKQLAHAADYDDEAQQQLEQKQLLSLTAAASASAKLTANTSYEECSRTTEAGIINGASTIPSLPLLCAQTSATSLQNENEKVAEKVLVGANFLVGNTSVKETHENCDTVPSNANSKEAKSRVLSPSQSTSKKVAFNSSSSTSSGNWPHVNGALNMTIKSGIKDDDISSSIETIVQNNSSSTHHDCNSSSSDDNTSNASSPISDNEHSNIVSENEVTAHNVTANIIKSTKNNSMSPDSSRHTILSKKSSLSSASSSGSSGKDNDLTNFERTVCSNTSNDDGMMTGSGGEMEEDEDDDLEDGETPMNLSPALDQKMITEVIDNNITTNSNRHNNQQNLSNPNNRNGNGESQVEAINLCKNNDSIHDQSRNILPLSPTIRINPASSSIGLSAKMRLKKQRLAMEAAAAAAVSSESESGNMNQANGVRPISPSAVSNSLYQQNDGSLSSKSKYPDANGTQSMDVVMNLSGKKNVNGPNVGRPDQRTSIYTRWSNNHQSSNDVDSSALHRLAEAAEWKQVGL